MLACACNPSLLGDTAKPPWVPGYSKLQWDCVLKEQNYYRKLPTNITVKEIYLLSWVFELGSQAVQAVLELEDDLELLILLPLSPTADWDNRHALPCSTVKSYFCHPFPLPIHLLSHYWVCVWGLSGVFTIEWSLVIKKIKYLCISQSFHSGDLGF